MLEELSDLAEKLELVRMKRSIPGVRPSVGFLVGASKTLLLLNVLSDRIDLDGYEVLRVCDVSSLEGTFAKKAFYLEGLRLKELKPAPRPDVRLEDAPACILSAQAAFPLLVLDRELIDPDVSEVGRVVLIADGRVQLRPISPTARWSEGMEMLRVEDITRIAFGGEYEATLALVAKASGR